ncbi:hypothetical protein GCM10029976_052330 [Kribbella albertanoniae]|uniref:WXG100 family type VII secretion target n=1 Tax=Kribbella albertanoniae TaxID=1266829 RepID=A0A4R4Q5U9_9ACTN|nr:WXG100 family type VII secretion target [Kribbella albertanoniae]TDC30460.1 hypothetical protein E1261_13320 [Kribbella albertanoniae]
MASPTDQMHMVTESAQHAATMAASTAESMSGHVTRLSGVVGSVVGGGWHMDQAFAFGNAHQNWADGMAKLIAALNKMSADTTMHMADYEETDTAQAAQLVRTVQTPSFAGIL